jgi:tetratricopeptide (TPR) repeat protein
MVGSALEGENFTMLNSFSSLTAHELLTLALDASLRSDSRGALGYLHEVATRTDVSPPALFMLGSEYAQLGMLDEAKHAMSRAIEIDPDYPIARFQLGLLHLSSGAPQTAVAVWQPLATLDLSHPQAYLTQFQRGMCHLIADEFDAALLALREGIALNNDNEPLNGDMRRIVASIEQLPGRADTEAIADVSPPGDAAEAESGHLFISAYAKSDLSH